MGTVYRTKQGEVFNCEHWIESDTGDKYALNENDFPEIHAIALADLATVNASTFDFIVEHFPDYEHCQEAAELDDLDCLIYGECDDEKTERITSTYGSDTKNWKHARAVIYTNMIQVAIEEYNKTFL